MNKKVFRPVLKQSSVCVALKWSGRLFHSRGAAAAKARSPMVRSLVFGICRDRLLLDLRGRVDVWGVMSSCR